MARLNITVVVPVPATKPLDDDPTDAFLTSWKTHGQGAGQDVDDAAWNVSEMRKIQDGARYYHGPEDLPESDDGILRQED